MDNVGIVVSINDKNVKIRVDRESACGGSCSQCEGCSNKAVFVDTETDLSLEKGDRVKIIMDTHSFMKNIFWGYGVLVIAIILGAILGYIFLKSEFGTMMGALLALIITYFVIKNLFKNKKENIELEKIY